MAPSPMPRARRRARAAGALAACVHIAALVLTARAREDHGFDDAAGPRAPLADAGMLREPRPRAPESQPRRALGAAACATPCDPSRRLCAAACYDAVLDNFDAKIRSVMSANAQSGAWGAAFGGKLVRVRAEGTADAKGNVRYHPLMRQRILSTGKLVTAVACLVAQEKGILKLSDRVLSVVYTGTKLKDSRAQDITLDHLLRHRSGLRSNSMRSLSTTPSQSLASLDPSFGNAQVAYQLGFYGSRAATAQDVLNLLLETENLHFAPGGGYKYSNVAYNTAGLYLEKMAGMPYEQFVLEHVLRPMGVHNMRCARTLREDAMPGEAELTASSSYPMNYGCHKIVAVEGDPDPAKCKDMPYGTFSIEMMCPAGGWITNVPDYLRFLESIDSDPAYKDFVSASSSAAIRSGFNGDPKRGTWHYGLASWLYQYSSGGPKLMYHEGISTGAMSYFNIPKFTKTPWRYFGEANQRDRTNPFKAGVWTAYKSVSQALGGRYEWWDLNVNKFKSQVNIDLFEVYDKLRVHNLTRRGAEQG